VPRLTDSYPEDLPGFISRKAAPREWQALVQQLDPDLWIVWNPHRQDGPCWSVMRYVGHMPAQIPIIGRGGSDGEDGLLKAIRAGWSFVRSLEYPDGTGAQELVDLHLLQLFKDDFWRKYGREKGEAALLLAERREQVAIDKEAEHKAAMKDAFADTLADGALTRGATSVVMTGAK
jgi:hypothetical protein